MVIKHLDRVVQRRNLDIAASLEKELKQCWYLKAPCTHFASSFCRLWPKPRLSLVAMVG